MKNLLLFIILIGGLAYYFVPYDLKVSIFEKIGIDSSIIPDNTEVIEQVKGELVKLHFDDNNKDSFKGNISNGVIMSDLSWASNAYVKCFYPDNYTNFDGNVVLHRIILLKNKNISIKLIEDSPENNLSMYVYKTDALSKEFPPEKSYVHDCVIDLGEGADRLIEMDGNTAPSDIVIGISGKNGALAGGYTLELEQK